MKKKLVTIKQAELLKKLGFNEPCTCSKTIIIHGDDIYPFIGLPTVDEVIDWLRRKHDVIIYDRFEPVVDPVKKGRIMYCYSVKFCDRKHGWNFRENISYGIVSNNVYASKRYAINKALKYIEKKNAARRKRSTNRKR